jgi:hypothetical protein
MESGPKSNAQDNWMGKVFVDVEWNSQRLNYCLEQNGRKRVYQFCGELKRRSAMNLCQRWSVIMDQTSFVYKVFAIETCTKNEIKNIIWLVVWRIISSFLFLYRRLCFAMNWGPFLNYCSRVVCKRFWPLINGPRGLFCF